MILSEPNECAHCRRRGMGQARVFRRRGAKERRPRISRRVADARPLVGALAAVILLLLFTVAISLTLAKGRRPACHCFGQFSNAPVGWFTVGRNLFLATGAAVVGQMRRARRALVERRSLGESPDGGANPLPAQRFHQSATTICGPIRLSTASRAS
jgi:hypothetical protein